MSCEDHNIQQLIGEIHPPPPQTQGHSLLSSVIRKILWIMWLTLSCSQSSCRERKERLISATESSLSSMLSDTESSDSEVLSSNPSATTHTNHQHRRVTSTDSVNSDRLSPKLSATTHTHSCS